ncbi:MAG: hypothetical protein IPQ07_22010 [Myxococcales bacterium]|nr:hypothetical protein [Myxococcales bacterium]
MKYGLLFLLAACGDSSGAPDASLPRDAAADASWVHVDDGTPTRQACTQTLGNALGTAFGRLDGLLVAIVPPGNGGCNADANHVHLQVRMNGAIYDIAVDVGGMNGVEDVHTTTRDLVMPGGPWSEGFHPSIPTDYVALGVHAAALTLESRQVLTSQLMSELATANHVSVYATPYGPDGAHLVHRNGSGHDGMIVTQPLSTPAHLRMFSFTSQAF